jgi:hypothetical protein
MEIIMLRLYWEKGQIAIHHFKQIEANGLVTGSGSSGSDDSSYYWIYARQDCEVGGAGTAIAEGAVCHQQAQACGDD